MSPVSTMGVGINQRTGELERYQPPGVVPEASGASVAPTRPGSPQPGQMWWSGTALELWDGASWQVMGGGGALTLPLGVGDGGTGATTAAAAITALMPTGGTQYQALIKGAGTAFDWGAVGARNNNSTAAGNQALAAHTTGNANTAFGNQAMMTLTNGGNNTAVGSGAFRTNLNGFRNTAVGVDALAVVTTNDNTAVGYQTLGAATGSTTNTAIGSSALANIVFTSNSNTAVGMGAGATLQDGSTAVTNLNNGVYIGNRSSPSAVTGITNEIAIGTGSIGHGSNTATIGASTVTQLWLGNTRLDNAFVALGGGTVTGAVTMGAPDSGGTGFRQLVVPN